MTRLLLAAGALLTANAAFSADTNAIVVQVGKQTMSVGELRRRWSDLPASQRQALGKTDRAALQAYIDRFVVPEFLLAEAAREKPTLSPERRANLEKMVLQQVLAQRIRQESEVKSPVTDSDIKAYLDEHRQDFDHPERLRLFRILVATETEAGELIKKAHEFPDFEAWRTIAREKSLDKTTSMRGGDLGFVSADGHSDLVELEVNPALYVAAARVKDGELVKTPVREKDKFAVVWRRGRVPAERANSSSVAAIIRAQIRETRAQNAFDDLVSQLRAKYVTDLNPGPLETLELQSPAAIRTVASTGKPDAVGR